MLIAVAVFMTATVGLIAAMPVDQEARLTAVKAHERAARGDLLILDVRAEREWRRTGMPGDAVGVSVHDADGRVGFLVTALVAVDGDRSRPIATICDSGERAARASAWLREAGFDQVYTVKEGLYGRHDETGHEPGWLNRGLPITVYEG